MMNNNINKSIIDNRNIDKINSNKATKPAKVNYQKELEKILKKIEDEGTCPSLLLHSCCGPCSSYVLEYLGQYFEITVFYYNPNIYPSEEYWYRVDEQKKIIDLTKARYPIHMIEGAYEVNRFYETIDGMKDLPEGGARCHKCYELRMSEAAKLAKEEGFDYFTTTLTISPHKNSQVLNRIGQEVGARYGVSHLPSDFKKNNGYKRSCKLTSDFGMYRQDYCGCEYSMKETMKRRKKKLRDELKVINEGLDPAYMAQADQAIFDKLYKRPEYLASRVIFTYAGRYPEVDTIDFIEKALGEGKIVAVPYCSDRETMKPYKIQSISQLVMNSFGVLEPDIDLCQELGIEEIDLILVPCCTADIKGARLGFGRGYYDRFLPRSKAEKILLIRSRQMSEDIPMEDHDLVIDKLISEIEI